jgi:hypothetical protein
MKKYLVSLIIIILSLQFYGCISLKSQSKLAVIEGVRGQVFEKKGNAMPMKGQKATKGTLLQTVVYVFEPTTLLKVEGLNGQICTKVNSVLVDSVNTDMEGKYIIGLKPGKYTLMVKYGRGFFVPYLSGTNELSIIEILPKQLSELDIIVNAKASY